MIIHATIRRARRSEEGKEREGTAAEKANDPPSLARLKHSCVFEGGRKALQFRIQPRTTARASECVLCVLKGTLLLNNLMLKFR